MASTLLNQLGEKIHRAAAEIHSLRKERDRLAAEVALMEEESRRARRLLREHADMRAQRDKIRARLEKIVANLDRLSPQSHE